MTQAADLTPCLKQLEDISRTKVNGLRYSWVCSRKPSYRNSRKLSSIQVSRREHFLTDTKKPDAGKCLVL